MLSASKFLLVVQTVVLIHFILSLVNSIRSLSILSAFKLIIMKTAIPTESRKKLPTMNGSKLWWSTRNRVWHYVYMSMVTSEKRTLRHTSELEERVQVTWWLDENTWRKTRGTFQQWWMNLCCGIEVWRHKKWKMSCRCINKGSWDFSVLSLQDKIIWDQNFNTFWMSKRIKKLIKCFMKHYWNTLKI